MEKTPSKEDLTKEILEHLTKEGYLKAVKALKDDMKAKKKPKTKSKKNVDEMLKSFDSGDQAKFISLWNESVRKNDNTGIYGSKIEFYVRIYFTIYPMHSISKLKNGDKVLKQRQKEFQKFLETKGSELSKTSEFLPYYALPYVPNPTDHPSFKQLFSTEWIKNLKEKLNEFLRNVIIDSGDQSNLAKIYTNYLKNPNKDDFNFEPDEGVNEEVLEQMNMLQARCKQLEKQEQNTKMVFLTSQQKWSNFSKNILIIAKQLMSVVDNSGISDSINTIVYKSMKEKLVKYENVLSNIMQGQPAQTPNQNSNKMQSKVHSSGGSASPAVASANRDGSISPVSNKVDYSPITPGDADPTKSPSMVSQSVSYNQDMDHSVSRGPRTLPINITLAPLDYDKIKKFMLESDDELKICATLQALRWRISKSRSYSQRAEVLHTYMHYDILGLLDSGPDILINLLNKSRRVLAYTVFLVNTMASEPTGRNYLIKYDPILDTIFAVLLNEKSETAIRQQAIVAIQKFSLRPKCQSKMIEMDMIKYIVYCLSNELNTMSETTLEYTTALLMNLSLRKSGKDKCEDPNLELLQVLNELLEHENDQIRTYVNGTLYSIFRRKSLRIQAKSLGMDEALTYLAENMQPNEDHLKRQIHYILEQLNAGDQDLGDSSDEEEDDEDDEDDEDVEGEDDEELEEEGDYDDTIAGVKVGEELLMSEFLAPTNDAMRQTTTIRTKIEEEKKNRGLDSTSRSMISDIKRSNSRPITPTKSNSKIPFIEQYMKSPMRTRDKIPRTPYDGDETDLSRNDFQNDDVSNLEHSIVVKKDNFQPPVFGKVEDDKVENDKVEEEETKVEKRPPKDPKPSKPISPTKPINPIKPHNPDEAFIKKDRIPRTPPHITAKQYAPTPEVNTDTDKKSKGDKKEKGEKKSKKSTKPKHS